MPQRVTMSDVAQRAGVSLMTVSRVINNKGEVSAETRQRVLDIIQELGYRPSGIARSLATQQTRTVGLVVPDIANPFFSNVARGTEELAYANGYNVFLCNTEESPPREYDVLQSLEEKRVDGLILCSSRLEDNTLHQLLIRHPAAVLVNRILPPQFGSNVYETVILDDALGSQLAVEHLLERGHRSIGALAGPSISFSGRRRLQGYLSAMEQAGLNVPNDWVRHCAPTVEGGQTAALHLLGSNPQLEALICYNDLVAVGSLSACMKLGLRVPDDLAVIGYDDIPLAALVTPPLTTCRVPSRQLGEQAMHLLLDRINDCPEDCAQIVFEPELVLRRSAP